MEKYWKTVPCDNKWLLRNNDEAFYTKKELEVHFLSSGSDEAL